MFVKTYNQNGEEIGKTKLPKEIFDVPLNSDLVHQVVVSQLANRRQKIAHTKDRGEVKGGGRKPWRQKGTGRARHGSIRSPLWKGGGVTFGPTKDKVFKKKIPKKMKRKALFMALSAKAKDNLLILLDKLKIEKPKTKEIAEILNNLLRKELKNKRTKEQISALIALPEYDKKIILASRNIPKIETTEARELNALDVLSFKYLLMPKESIKVIKDTFL
ncbi:MAG: 50S ribosomal protein L4 [Patescibacteria group bacterium]|nr:50S ribosomal protein L4 [Patescibacteria group bacterium]